MNKLTVKQAADILNMDVQSLRVGIQQGAFSFGTAYKVKIKDILLPNCSNGKVRVPEAEVIREVPLEECGLYGKILMARRKK